MASSWRHTLFLVLITVGVAHAQSVLEVYKSPDCGCCEKWVAHLQANGFTARSKNVSDIPAVRKEFGMPDRLGACHTAKIGGYVVEGHVPASDIQRLLREKPKAMGIAVPSMPPGSPGMESRNPIPYDTLLVRTDGSAQVFAHH